MRDEGGPLVATLVRLFTAAGKIDKAWVMYRGDV